MHIEKEMLPKGLSYPVQTGMITNALEEAEITLDCSVNYYNNTRMGFTAYFWPVTPNAPFERLYLTIGAVTGEQAAEIRQRMRESVLPALVNWVRNLLALPTDSPVRREQQEFHIRF
jgi:hypothetical protein